MKLNKIVSFVAVGVVIPGTIIASNSSVWADVKVSTPNVEAVTKSDGSIYVNTGNTTVRVPSRRRYWTPWRYWRLPWQSYSSPNSNCRHSSHQTTTRVTATGSQTIQSSVTSDRCN